jgi:8-oxo-dGTP diphosphatase
MHGLPQTVVCRNRLTGEIKEVLAEKLQFRPGAYAVIIQDGKVLLSPQWDGWDFPGGGIEKGETFEQALVREVKEETGLDARPGALLHVTQDFFIANYMDDTYFHSLCFYYTCTDPRGEISTAGFAEYEKKYMKAAEWVPLEKIDGLKFYNPVNSPELIRKAALLLSTAV